MDGKVKRVCPRIMDVGEINSVQQTSGKASRRR